MLTDLGFEVGKMFGSTSETAGIVAGIVEHFDRRVGMNGTSTIAWERTWTGGWRNGTGPMANFRYVPVFDKEVSSYSSG